MIESLTALASENSNPSLRSLVEDVQRGHIRVPRFQRPFIWTDEQRLELLASVRDGMPIGSLLVWRTTKFELATFPTVGPHAIPASARVATLGWQYLLDGHQRVSTLLGLLLPVPEHVAVEPDDSQIDWAIEYDLEIEEFVFRTKRLRARRHAPLLPLWTLFDGRLVNKHMRAMRGHHKNASEQELDQWEARADQLSYQFQQFRVPIVAMVTDDLNLAAKAFQRINSLGTPMSEAHLVAALSWRPDFDLRERIENIRETLRPEWRAIEDNLYLQICKGLCGLDLTRPGQSELVKAIETNYGLLDEAALGLREAINLLHEAGVTRAELLPYGYQLTLIAIALAHAGFVDERTRQSIIDWFWRSSWSEAFASSSFRQVRAQQQLLHAAIYDETAISDEWEMPEKLPSRFDFRSARSRLLMMRMAIRIEKEGKWLLSEYGRFAMVRFVPPPSDASPKLKRLCQGPGNRFLVSPLDPDILHRELVHGSGVNAFLYGHLIDEEMLKMYQRGDLEGFLQRRTEEIELWDFAEWSSLAGSRAQFEQTLPQYVDLLPPTEKRLARFGVRIIGSDGQPVVGARIALIDSQGWIRRSRTDHQGRCSMDFHPAQPYEFLVAAASVSGFQYSGLLPEEGGDLRLEPLQLGGSIICDGKVKIPGLSGTFSGQPDGNVLFRVELHGLLNIREPSNTYLYSLNEPIELADPITGRYVSVKVKYMTGQVLLLDYRYIS
ncbi:hypothetical protein PIN31009_03011 [Pandoraea iniqua]|uniref:GmrSD restriction endonuclease domain-containing protein n=1 Tax=Pandoraea iniqua TaxID=2508288 RepID=UPI001242E3D6|nr:DUF262 domain-containing protein [Pandoraea iniqua]VVE18609.1 hypothetical protein PIN31009_03011 [Pandoraea iniqua]